MDTENYPVDSAIHRINIRETICAIQWIENYPVDSAIHRISIRETNCAIQWILRIILWIVLSTFNFEQPRPAGSHGAPNINFRVHVYILAD